MRDRGQFTLVVLTFLGMVGLYYGLWKAYQLWQSYQPKIQQLQQSASSVGGLLNLLK
jgi:hypothetical protein